MLEEKFVTKAIALEQSVIPIRGSITLIVFTQISKPINHLPTVTNKFLYGYDFTTTNDENQINCSISRWAAIKDRAVIEM